MIQLEWAAALSDEFHHRLERLHRVKLLFLDESGDHSLDKEDWEIVERKFRQRGGTYAGYGLVVRPK